MAYDTSSGKTTTNGTSTGLCLPLMMMLLLMNLPASALRADAAEADSAKAVALHFVEATGAGSNLMGIASQVAPTTQTFAALVAETDERTANQLLQQALEAARPDYQDQWNANLATAYLEHMEANELASVAEQLRDSDHFEKLLAQQDKIGASMQALSRPLLSEFVSQALSSALLAVETDEPSDGRPVDPDVNPEESDIETNEN